MKKQSIFSELKMSKSFIKHIIIVGIILYNYVDSKYFSGFVNNEEQWTLSRSNSKKYENTDNALKDKIILESKGYNLIFVIE